VSAEALARVDARVAEMICVVRVVVKVVGPVLVFRCLVRES
jgi:hypothetical protein